MDWVLSGDTSSFFQPSSMGSRILHGLRSCWHCTEHGSGMSNSSLDSASTIKDQSQFQTCWGWKHICQSLAKKTDFFLIKKKCTIHLFWENLTFYTVLYTFALFGNCHMELKLGILCDAYSGPMVWHSAHQQGVPVLSHADFLCKD